MNYTIEELKLSLIGLLATLDFIHSIKSSHGYELTEDELQMKEFVKDVIKEVDEEMESRQRDYADFELHLFNQLAKSKISLND